jgi:hypothetical protein
LKLCKINLDQTNYAILPEAKLLDKPDIDIAHLQSIFYLYCKHKRFKSVQPIFDSEFLSPETDVITYSHQNKTVAFSILRRYTSTDLEAIQFAWNYKTPSLKLGINSLKHECALYKSLGYQNLYLGETAYYKQQFDGYEELKGLC